MKKNKLTISIFILIGILFLSNCKKPSKNNESEVEMENKYSEESNKENDDLKTDLENENE